MLQAGRYYQTPWSVGPTQTGKASVGLSPSSTATSVFRYLSGLFEVVAVDPRDPQRLVPNANAMLDHQRGKSSSIDKDYTVRNCLGELGCFS